MTPSEIEPAALRLLAQCLNQLRHRVRTKRWVDGHRHAPAVLLPGKRPGIYFTGGWVGLGRGMEGCEKLRSTAFRNPNSIYTPSIIIFP